MSTESDQFQETMRIFHALKPDKKPKRILIKAIVISVLAPFAILGFIHSSYFEKRQPLSQEALEVQKQFSELSVDEQSQIVKEWNSDQASDNAIQPDNGYDLDK